MSCNNQSSSSPLCPPLPCNSQNLKPQQHATNNVRRGMPSVNDVLLPPLEPEDDLPNSSYYGPTDESNWVIPGHLLVGAFPSSLSDKQHFQNIQSLLQQGIDTFVCLQQEYKHEDMAHEEWSSGSALRPYFFDAVAIRRRAFPREPNFAPLEFVHFPIVDCAVADDVGLLNLCKQLTDKLKRGKVLYVHCWGGHGRTGTVISIILHMVYGLDAKAAMRRCQLLHDIRKCPVDVPSPQTQSQRKQVCRVIEMLQMEHQEITGSLQVSLCNPEQHDKRKDASPMKSPTTVMANASELSICNNQEFLEKNLPRTEFCEIKLEHSSVSNNTRANAKRQRSCAVRPLLAPKFGAASDTCTTLSDSLPRKYSQVRCARRDSTVRIAQTSSGT